MKERNPAQIRVEKGGGVGYSRLCLVQNCRDSDTTIRHVDIRPPRRNLHGQVTATLTCGTPTCGIAGGGCRQ